MRSSLVPALAFFRSVPKRTLKAPFSGVSRESFHCHETETFCKGETDLTVTRNGWPMSACEGAVKARVLSAAKREVSRKSRMIKIVTVLFTVLLLPDLF